MACARMVAVVVPSPAMSEVFEATSRTIWAPMFSSGSFSSISLATVTPSLVIVGDPNFLSRMTLRPLGPRVTFTALARLFTPRRMPCRDESPYTICFAITDISCRLSTDVFRFLLPSRLEHRGPVQRELEDRVRGDADIVSSCQHLCSRATSGADHDANRRA